MIIKYQGESLILERDVIDRLGVDYNFDGATVIFSVTTYTFESLMTKTPTVDGSVISVELTPLETSTMLGRYIYEFKIMDINGRVDMIDREEFLVVRSNNPTFGTGE